MQTLPLAAGISPTWPFSYVLATRLTSHSQREEVSEAVEAYDEDTVGTEEVGTGDNRHPRKLSRHHLNRPNRCLPNLRKGEPVCFGPLSEEKRDTMKKLQIKLISPSVLELPRFTGRYTVDTDACDRKVGCVLLQEQTDGTKNQSVIGKDH